MPLRQRRGLSTGTRVRYTAKGTSQFRADLRSGPIVWVFLPVPPTETPPVSPQGLLHAVKKGSPATADLQFST